MPALPASVSSNPGPVRTKASRLLVIGTSWLGDCIMAMPAIQDLRRRFPQAHIAVLSKPGVAAVWRLFRDVDEVLSLETGALGTLRTVRRVRERSFDFAYVLPRSVRSSLIPFIARIPGRCGLEGHRGRWLLTEVAALPPESAAEHQSVEYMRLMNVEDREPVAVPLIHAMPEDRARVGVDIIGAAGVAPGTAPLVGVFAGAARGPSKQWPAERFAEVARRLSESHGAAILVLGTGADAAGGSCISGRLHGKAINLCGKTTLAELAAVVSQCRLVLSNDSGGMHLAAALGVPVVAVFGLTDPAKTGPLGSNCRVVMADSVRRGRDIPRHSWQARSALLSIRAETVYSAAVGLLRDTDGLSP